MAGVVILCQSRLYEFPEYVLKAPHINLESTNEIRTIMADEKAAYPNQNSGRPAAVDIGHQPVHEPSPVRRDSAGSSSSSSPDGGRKDGRTKITLVTGGCGFIGSYMVNILLRKGLRVLVLDRMDICACPRKIDAKYKDRYELIVGDISNKAWLTQIFKKYRIQTVFHFAAETHVDNSYIAPFRFTHSNVVGTQVLLECCAHIQKPKRFVHISTDEVYGTTPDDGAASNENSPIDPTNPYSASKAAAEALVRGYGHSFDMNWVIVRGNNAFGPGQYPEKVVPRWSLQALAGEPFTLQGDGQQTRSFIYVEDFARAVWYVYCKGAHGEVYNIGGAEEISLLDLARHIHKLSGKDKDNAEPRFKTIPDRSFNDLRYIIDGSKIRSLGWEVQTSFDVGLRKTFEYYKQYNCSEWHKRGNWNARKWLVWGADGVLGKLICEYIFSQGDIVVQATSRPEKAEEVTPELWSVRPDNCICAVSSMGSLDDAIPKREDTAQDQERENVKSNFLAPYTLAVVCSRAGVHLTYIGNVSVPESYGIITSSVDTVMDMFGDSVLNARVRVPFTAGTSETSIAERRRLALHQMDAMRSAGSQEQSITVVDDVLPALFEMAAARKVGSFDLVNPGAISPAEIMKLYREIVDPQAEWKNDQLAPSTPAPVLDAELVQEWHGQVKNARDALVDVFSQLDFDSGDATGSQSFSQER